MFQGTLSELDKPGYADPFYEAGSERIDQLLKNGAVTKTTSSNFNMEKNKKLVNKYFSNFIPAKYINYHDIAKQFIIEAIFTKLNDPKYPDSFKMLCVNILEDTSYGDLRGTIINNYIKILESYGWQEDAPQWLIRDALGKNGTVGHALEDYKLRTEARDILRRNNVDEIINKLLMGSLSDILKYRFFSLPDQEKSEILRNALDVPTLRKWATHHIKEHV